MPHRLSELQPQHHAAIRMRIEGNPTKGICERLGVEKRTIYLWFSDPLVKAELALQVRRINELFAERLAGPALKAIDELKELALQPAQGQMTHETKLKILREIVYTGNTVWNRLDFTEAKHAGGGARQRAREEWVVSKDTHLALVSDQTFEAAPERFSAKGRGNGSSHAKRSYVLSGMVRCCAGHGPLSMQGKARRGAPLLLL